MTDLYGCLRVEPTASADVIRIAYRRLAFQHHPDRNPDNPMAADHFKRIHAAYVVLANPERRAVYDAAHGQPSRRISGRSWWAATASSRRL